MIMPVTGQQQIKVLMSKFYIAGEEDAPASDYTWNVTNQFDEDGIFMGDNVAADDVIAEVDPNKIPASGAASTYMVLGQRHLGGHRCGNGLSDDGRRHRKVS
jgi:hypothetical protein